MRDTQALRIALAAAEENEAAATTAAAPTLPATMASGGRVLVAEPSDTRSQKPADATRTIKRDASARAELWMSKNNLATVCAEVMRVVEALRPVMRHQVRVHGGLYSALLAPQAGATGGSTGTEGSQ